MVLKALKVTKALKALLERKDLKEKLEHKDFKVSKVILAHLVRLVLTLLFAVLIFLLLRTIWIRSMIMKMKHFMYMTAQLRRGYR